MGWPPIPPPPLTEGVVPIDPTTQPLPVAPPATWLGREERVAWCLRNLTSGEKARLYWLLHKAEDLRLDRCEYIAHQERKTLKGAP